MGLFDFFLFFSIPMLLWALWGFCLFCFIHAKRKKHRFPESYTERQIRRRLVWLIVVSVVVGILTGIALGFVGLMYMIALSM